MATKNRKTVRKSRKIRKSVRKICKNKMINSKRKGGGVWDSIKNALYSNDAQVPTVIEGESNTEMKNLPIQNTVTDVQSNGGGYSRKRNNRRKVRS